MTRNIPSNLLKMRQQMPLILKVRMSQTRIRTFGDHFQGNSYIAFSGGKDSTVLLDIVRSVYPNTPAVFVDTGLEYPEIREFVKTIDNVIWLKPKMNFKQVLEKYGHPIISKSISMAISRYKNTKSKVQKKLRLYGGINPSSGKVQKMGVIPKKWHFLINAPFKISDKCCDIMKKNPFKDYEKETKLKPFIGTLAIESNVRKMEYLKYGCNMFEKKNPQSTPISFWTEQDIWEYIKINKLNYSKIYDMGVNRTGCMFCMFGVHMEKEPNRFQLMKETHPKQYEYCINKLGCGNVLDCIEVKYD